MAIEIIITVEGGVVQSVHTDTKEVVNVQLIDWDNIETEDNPELEAEYKELEKKTKKMRDVL